MGALTYVLAFLAAATSFPVMVAKHRALPDLSRMPQDTHPRISEPGRLYHDLKNLATEAVRADSQWFAKAGSFTALALLAALVSSVLL